jgi:hypothetical protein
MKGNLDDNTSELSCPSFILDNNYMISFGSEMRKIAHLISGKK